MATVFPVLIGEIAKRGIKKNAIAKRLGIANRTLFSKLSGETSFTWDEVCRMQECFFPDLDVTTLFQRDESQSA
mgnify:FL=1